jgi:hypothetical protein
VNGAIRKAVTNYIKKRSQPKVSVCCCIGGAALPGGVMNWYPTTRDEELLGCAPLCPTEAMSLEWGGEDTE